MALYRDPRAREGDYLGPLYKGQALRFTGNVSKNKMYAEVVALNPDGSEQKARGWAFRGLLKPKVENTDTLRVYNLWLKKGRPSSGAGLPSCGPNSCAESLRKALNLDGWSKHAKDSGRVLMARDGYKQRPGNIIHHGDIVVYAGDWGSYKGGGKGHIGIAVEENGKMYLFSHLTGKGWTRTAIGSGIIGVYYK